MIFVNANYDRNCLNFVINIYVTPESLYICVNQRNKCKRMKLDFNWAGYGICNQNVSIASKQLQRSERQLPLKCLPSFSVNKCNPYPLSYMSSLSTSASVSYRDCLQTQVAVKQSLQLKFKFRVINCPFYCCLPHTHCPSLSNFLLDQKITKNVSEICNYLLRIG